MNNVHLNDFLDLSDELDVKTGDLVSLYTAKAIEFSVDGFSPCVVDYDKAYVFVMELYKNV